MMNPTFYKYFVLVLSKQLRNCLAEGWTVIFTAGRMGVFRSDGGSVNLFRKTVYRDIKLCIVETMSGYLEERAVFSFR